MKNLKNILQNLSQRSNEEIKEYPPEFQPA